MIGVVLLVALLGFLIGGCCAVMGLSLGLLTAHLGKKPFARKLKGGFKSGSYLPYLLVFAGVGSAFGTAGYVAVQAYVLSSYGWKEGATFASGSPVSSLSDLVVSIGVRLLFANWALCATFTLGAP